ncbi:MAG: capping complex subunit for YIEGIA [Halanaerobiales bacterium]
MGESNILAIITTKNNRDKVGGGVPIFYADSLE